MSVLIQQLSLRQLKALAKRLQAVIPAELNLPSVSLHQAQSIVAKGLGHADFHAAQRFHHDTGRAMMRADPDVLMIDEARRMLKGFGGRQIHNTPMLRTPFMDDDALVGPPEHIVEVLMQRLGRRHAPEWPYWHARRLLIRAAVMAAWNDREGASLTPRQVREELTPSDLGMFQATDAGRAYLHFLHRTEGSSDRQHLGERAMEQHGASVIDWTQLLPSALSPDAIARTRTFEFLSSQLERLLRRAYPHSPRLNAHGIAHFVRENQGMWTQRASDLLETAWEALMQLMPPGAEKTQGHLLDLLDNLDLRWVLAHDQSPLSPELRDRFREHLVSLPGWNTGFSLTAEVPEPSRGTYRQQQHLASYWVALRRANELA